MSFEFGNSKLAKYTTGLPQDTKLANTFISNLLKNTPKVELKGTAKGGWKPDAFVTPYWVESKSGAVYRWLGALPGPGTHYQMGTTRRWRRRIAKLCSSSNYLVLAIEAALAAPLLKFANLSELAIFHLWGEDSTGKTTASKICHSVSGPPGSILQWNSTARRFEEDCAQHNDLPMALNAAEKAALKSLKEVFQLIVHELSEGKSSTRSIVVQEYLPDLTWGNVILSTGNLSGEELANLAGITWGGAEEVRFISIPVPPPNEAGIFDRLAGTREERVAQGAKLIRTLEAALTESYGVIFRRWVRRLMAEDPSTMLRNLIDRFVDRVKPLGAHERRIAEKFGLLYAAGMLAVMAGLLPWDKNLPLVATALLYRRAITQEVHPGRTLLRDLRALKDAIKSDDRCPRVASGGTLVAKDQVIGARSRYQGKRIIALRHSGLTGVVPNSARAAALLSYLKTQGALTAGHGGKTAQQIALPAKINGKLVQRPRYLIIDAVALEKLFRRRGLLVKRERAARSATES